MQTCPFCAVKIVGDKRCCPLCGGPLQGNGAPELEVFPPLRSPRFTNATILRAMALFGITATIICILINLAVGTQIWWSLFVAAGLLCIFLSAVVAIIYRRDIIQNIGWQVALVPILSILWDIGTGWLGWSLDFVLPCVCAMGLLMVLLLSLLLQLPIHSFTAVLGAASLLGLIPGVLAGFGLVQILLPSLLCSGLSAIVLATMLLFRWQIVKGEVSRRFHL